MGLVEWMEYIGVYPLVMTNSLLLKVAIEFMSFRIKKGEVLAKHSY